MPQGPSGPPGPPVPPGPPRQDAQSSGLKLTPVREEGGEEIEVNMKKKTQKPSSSAPGEKQFRADIAPNFSCKGCDKTFEFENNVRHHNHDVQSRVSLEGRCEKYNVLSSTWPESGKLIKFS